MIQIKSGAKIKTIPRGRLSDYVLQASLKNVANAIIYNKPADHNIVADIHVTTKRSWVYGKLQISTSALRESPDGCCTVQKLRRGTAGNFNALQLTTPSTDVLKFDCHQ